MIARYRAEKERRGLLDYDDLIDKTLTMLATVNPSWVHYKLDLGIDHVLIDEAQDTSPQAMGGDRPAGVANSPPAPARATTRRSIFAVGDEKQSIFSFQGAEPHRFAEMRRHFERRLQRQRPSVRHGRFQAFVPLGAGRAGSGRHRVRPPRSVSGLTADPVDDRARGRARRGRPAWSSSGRWSSRTRSARSRAGTRRSTTLTETAPAIKLARKIAASVKAWLGRERVTDLDTGAYRPVRPGDVLVLVRQRGALFEAVIRALKEAGIAVAGADRLMLTEHIAVMDLMVLADALLLPEDDLALATVLRSPLFDVTEEELFELAWKRPGSLRESLRESATTARGGVGDTRPLGGGGAARVAVRLLRPRARAGSRPRPHLAAARTGSSRRARRVPQSRARL